MMRFFSQMMKLPLAAVAYSMEMLVKTMQGMRMMADESIDMMVSGIAEALGDASDSESDLTSDITEGALGGHAATTRQTTYTEETSMQDQDLGGDDLKYVSYSILFTRRDYEATLLPETQEIVDYPTDGGSYGALKIGQFLRRVAHGDFDRPPSWVRKNYPPSAVGLRTWEIPEDDLKYLKFDYRVNRRLPKAEAEYAKDQVEVLRQIRDSIGPGR